MTHSLLHQILLSELVVPITMAHGDDQGSRTGFPVWLADDTWVNPDLVVFGNDQIGDDRSHVEGPPLLAVEVTSAASRERDLGSRRELYERFEVPSYWVVDLHGEDLRMHVFELADGSYIERAFLEPGESCWVTDPFRIELALDQIFKGLPHWAVRKRRTTMGKQAGPDLPAPGDRILADVFGYRWPTGAEKVELLDGCPIFYGEWDERDIEIAQRTYPGRQVLLDQPPGEPGTLRILPTPEP